MLLVAVLLVALGLLGWALFVLLHGRRARLKRRIAQVVGGDKASRAAQRASQMRRRPVQTRLRTEEEKAKWAYKLREQMMQAGLRIQVKHYLMACVALGAVAWGVAALLGHSLLAGGLAAAIVGFGIPKLVLGYLAKRRINHFTALFADALDIIVRGMRSGLPLGECINIIGREIGEPLGPEFRLVTEGQKLGLSLHESLERSLERNPSADFRYFTIVLAIQQQTGGNLAETLAKLSELLRSRSRMRAKIKAYSSEATASALIIGSLPIVVAILLFVVSRPYIMMLWETEPGNVLLFIGAVMMGGGSFIMRKMINFDI
jgi:tight adherence protein B